LVKKANDLIEARAYLSMPERRAFAVSVAFVKRVVDNVYGEAEIDFEVLQRVLEPEGLKVDKYFKKRLKEVLKGLKEKRELALIELPLKRYKEWLLENNKRDWIEKLGLTSLNDGVIYASIIEDVVVSDDKSKVFVRFNRFITPLILDLKKRYTLYELKYILLLKNQYAPALYEFLKKNENLGDFKISVEKLRNILGATAKSYSIWTRFNEKVLEPAVKEIDEKTDIAVSYKPIRRNHGKVTEVVFKVYAKGNLSKHLRELSAILETLIHSFRQGGEEITKEEFVKVLLSLRRVNPATVLWFLLHYPEGETRLFAWQHIRWVEENTKIAYPDRYLESLIKDKNPQLDWLLDQRTKDLIHKELEKLVKPQEGEEESGIEQLKREISQTYKFLSEKYRKELKTALGVEDFNEYLQGLVREGNLNKLKEVQTLANGLLNRQWEEEL